MKKILILMLILIMLLLNLLTNPQKENMGKKVNNVILKKKI